jgi:hypothetical protein
MELDDFKAIWAKEQKELESRLVLNEKLVMQMSLEKSQDKFNKLLEISILGRNMALVYMVLSIWLAFFVINELKYSIPAIFGGLAMLFSFMQHRHLKKPDLINMNTIELQKAISKFRIHTSKYSKYDMSIVLLWFMTIIPVCLKIALNISLYDSLSNTVIYLIIVGVFIILAILFFNKIYKKIDSELEENTLQLDLIKQFEER